MLDKLITNSLSTVSSALSTTVSTVISALFMKHNTNFTELAKIKGENFKKVTDILIESGDLSYMELYKLKNFAIVAEKADKYFEANRKKQDEKDSKQENISNGNDFDLDWYIRFFESVGNITNENLQELWAKILAGQALKKGKFSLRTLETLHNMSSEEAIIFNKLIPYVTFAYSGKADPHSGDIDPTPYPEGQTEGHPFLIC